MTVEKRVDRGSHFHRQSTVAASGRLLDLRLENQVLICDNNQIVCDAKIEKHKSEREIQRDGASRHHYFPWLLNKNKKARLLFSLVAERAGRRSEQKAASGPAVSWVFFGCFARFFVFFFVAQRAVLLPPAREGLLRRPALSRSIILITQTPIAVL